MPSLTYVGVSIVTQHFFCTAANCRRDCFLTNLPSGTSPWWVICSIVWLAGCNFGRISCGPKVFIFPCSILDVKWPTTGCGSSEMHTCVAYLYVSFIWYTTIFSAGVLSWISVVGIQAGANTGGQQCRIHYCLHSYLATSNEMCFLNGFFFSTR